ncbi:Uncharacterised protein g9994 [Pycnogonum litorale]
MDLKRLIFLPGASIDIWLIVLVWISTVESSVPSITYEYDFSNKGLETFHIRSFNNDALQNVTSLNLASNSLTTSVMKDAFSKLPMLEYLNLADNLISEPYTGRNGNSPFYSDCLFCSQKKLKFLDLSKNLMRVLISKSFEFLYDLERIDLSGNQLTSIARKLFSNSSKLKEINLSHNEITHINGYSFDEIPGLNTLNLNHNAISKLEDNSFSQLRQLDNLMLRGNRLKYFDSNLYWAENGTNLLFLDLRNNELSTLPKNVDTLMKIYSTIWLDNNQITCLPSNDTIPYINTMWKICGICDVLTDVALCDFPNITHTKKCDNEQCHHYRNRHQKDYKFVEYPKECSMCLCVEF